jgi:hypothetical protein
MSFKLLFAAGMLAAAVPASAATVVATALVPDLDHYGSNFFETVTSRFPNSGFAPGTTTTTNAGSTFQSGVTFDTLSVSKSGNGRYATVKASLPAASVRISGYGAGGSGGWSDRFTINVAGATPTTMTTLGFVTTTSWAGSGFYHTVNLFAGGGYQFIGDGAGGMNAVTYIQPVVTQAGNTRTFSYAFTVQGASAVIDLGAGISGTADYPARIADMRMTSRIIGSPGVTVVPTYGNYALSSAFVTTSVPEPANWALFIAAFGVVGATSRYRRTGGVRAVTA